MSRNTPPDILLFMSDQHHALYAGFAGHPIVATPHMDALAADGTVFDAAYTACPLCVPARSAMLTGRLPSRTGIFTNNGVIPSDHATFAHSLGAAGYDVVLCGRMHFLGEDQRHGFTRRLVGDYTPLYWGRYGAARADLGPFVGTSAREYDKVVGGGTSPVLEYDRAVIASALDYLEQDHDRPQCIVVGTYAPHHTFVAPPELYRRYRELADVPESFSEDTGQPHPVLAKRRRDDWDETLLRRIRAAYFGMITHLDDQLGQVRGAWHRFLDRRGSPGVFVYLSDHGEHAGEHRMQGKGTFFECSARIPLIVAGDGVQPGKRVSGPVSIMDVGPTLCELAAAEPPPGSDGTSLATVLSGEPVEPTRHVLSEYVDRGTRDEATPGRMVRRGKWKFITYAGYEQDDLLFDLETDPHEMSNLAKTEPAVAEALRSIALAGWDTEAIVRRFRENAAHARVLSRWGAAVDVDEPERWPVPDRFRTEPPPVTED